MIYIDQNFIFIWYFLGMLSHENDDSDSDPAFSSEFSSSTEINIKASEKVSFAEDTQERKKTRLKI